MSVLTANGRPAWAEGEKAIRVCAIGSEFDLPISGPAAKAWCYSGCIRYWPVANRLVTTREEVLRYLERCAAPKPIIPIESRRERTARQRRVDAELTKAGW